MANTEGTNDRETRNSERELTAPNGVAERSASSAKVRIASDETQQKDKLVGLGRPMGISDGDIAEIARVPGSQWGLVATG